MSEYMYNRWTEIGAHVGPTMCYIDWYAIWYHSQPTWYMAAILDFKITQFFGNVIQLTCTLIWQVN